MVGREVRVQGRTTGSVAQNHKRTEWRCPIERCPCVKASDAVMLNRIAGHGWM